MERIESRSRLPSGHARQSKCEIFERSALLGTEWKRSEMSFWERFWALTFRSSGLFQCVDAIRYNGAETDVPLTVIRGRLHGFGEAGPSAVHLLHVFLGFLCRLSTCRYNTRVLLPARCLHVPSILTPQTAKCDFRLQKRRTAGKVAIPAGRTSMFTPPPASTARW